MYLNFLSVNVESVGKHVIRMCNEIREYKSDFHISTKFLFCVQRMEEIYAFIDF